MLPYMAYMDPMGMDPSTLIEVPQPPESEALNAPSRGCFRESAQISAFLDSNLDSNLPKSFGIHFPIIFK